MSPSNPNGPQSVSSSSVETFDHVDSEGGQNQPKEGFAKKSLHSGAISILAQGINTTVQIGTTICLARLLVPEDFGLVAMVSALTGFANALMDLGTRDAAVQKSKLTQGEISTIFWLTAGIGASFTVLIVFTAPLIADFYHESQLERIAQFWSLSFLLNALSCQHSALLRRQLRFLKISIIEVTANVFGAVTAIAMALYGSGYWALVARPVVTSFLLLILIWSNCRWVPGIPTFSEGAKELVKFGMHLTGFTVTDYIARATDRVGLGYMVGAKELGYYHNAFTVYENAMGVVAAPLHSVAVATLSKLRDNLDELRRLWATAISSLTFFAMPAFVMLAVTGPDLIVFLLGEKWAPAGVLLSVFALRGPAQVVERTLGWLHVAAGRADRWMRWGIFSCVVQIIAVLCGLPFGTIGVATAFTVSMYLLFVPAIVYAGRPLSIGFSHLLKAVGPQLAGSFSAAIVGFGLRFTYLADASWIERFTVLILICPVAYLLVTVGVFKVIEPIAVAKKLILNFLPIRLSRLLGMSVAGQADGEP